MYIVRTLAAPGLLLFVSEKGLRVLGRRAQLGGWRSWFSLWSHGLLEIYLSRMGISWKHNRAYYHRISTIGIEQGLNGNCFHYAKVVCWKIVTKLRFLVGEFIEPKLNRAFQLLWLIIGRLKHMFTKSCFHPWFDDSQLVFASRRKTSVTWP